jgi:hypothetical protein
MRIVPLLASMVLGALLLGACSESAPAGASASPTGPVVTSLDTLPATVEGTLYFDLEGGAEGDGTDVYATLLFKGDHLSVKLPVPLARLLDLPDEGARVRVTIGSEEIDDGDSTLVITAAQRL